MPRDSKNAFLHPEGVSDTFKATKVIGGTCSGSAAMTAGVVQQSQSCGAVIIML